MHIRDCNKCRKEMHKEEQEAFLKHQYKIMQDMAYTFACHATAAALMVQTQRGRSKEYIQKMFDDMCMVYDTSTLFGKPIILPDVMKQLEKEYGIDFRRIHISLETEQEFIKGVKKNG